MSNRWFILAVLFLARFSMAFQFQSVGALAPVVANDYAANLADIGLLIGLYFAPGIFIAIPGGAIAARFGDRRVVFVGLLLMGIGGLLMSAGGTWSMLVIGRLVAGIGGVIISVLMTKMVTDWFSGREISTAMGIFINSWPLGIACALVVLPFVAVSGGLVLAWITVVSLIGIAALLFVVGYHPPDSATGAQISGQSGRMPLLSICLAGMVWALYNTALGMVFSFGPSLLSSRGWSLSGAGSIISLFTFLMAISVPLGGYLADRTGKHNSFIVVSLSGFAILLVVIPYLPIGLVLIAFVIMGLICGLAAGPIMSLPSLVLRPEARALGMGVFFSVYYVAFMIAPSLAGWIADQTGDIRMTFVLGMVMLGFCLAAFGLFRGVVAKSAAGP
jgi:MFS family permease